MQNNKNKPEEKKELIDMAETFEYGVLKEIPKKIIESDYSDFTTELYSGGKEAYLKEINEKQDKKEETR